MAFTFRSKRLGYDNIAEGSATGVERHNAGSSGETTRLTLDQRGSSTSALSQGMPEMLVDGWTSGTSFTSQFPEIVG